MLAALMLVNCFFFESKRFYFQAVVSFLRHGFCFRMDETKTSILPELVELTKDEKIEVRLAGLDTLVSILPLMDNGE